MVHRSGGDSPRAIVHNLFDLDARSPEFVPTEVSRCGQVDVKRAIVRTACAKLRADGRYSGQRFRNDSVRRTFYE